MQNMGESRKRELEVSEEKKELNIFRSMYYQLNAKPDSMSKVFSNSVIVSREDIIDLNQRVRNKIRMHCEEDDGYIATVTVNLKNKKVINFKCWEEFIAYEWNEVHPINSMILKWNFNVKMPQYEFPQNHGLMVKISSGLKPEEMLNLIFSGNIEDFEEIDTNTFPIAARVDFIEPLLGEELLNLVANWVSGLKKNSADKNPFLLIMRKYRKKVAYYFNYFAFFMLLILGTIIVNKTLFSFDAIYVKDITLNQMSVLFNVVIVVAVILTIALKILDRVAQKIYEKLQQYGVGFIFNITKGDAKKQEEILENNRKSGKSIALHFMASLLFNVACGIISAIII